MAVFVLGTLALVGFVCLNAFAGAELLRQRRIDQNLLLHPVEVAGRFGFIGVCAVLGWVAGFSPEQLGWRPEALAIEIGLGLAVAAVLQEVNHRATHWALGRWGRAVYSPAFLRVILPRDRREWPLTVLALFPAALAEEMLFRSLAIGGFSAFLPPLVLAAGFAAIFGLAHLPQGRLGVIGAGALGLCLGLLFIWRWNVVTCTVAHYVINVVQLVRAGEELRWFEEA